MQCCDDLLWGMTVLCMPRHGMGQWIFSQKKIMRVPYVNIGSSGRQYTYHSGAVCQERQRHVLMSLLNLLVSVIICTWLTWSISLYKTHWHRLTDSIYSINPRTCPLMLLAQPIKFWDIFCVIFKHFWTWLFAIDILWWLIAESQWNYQEILLVILFGLVLCYLHINLEHLLYLKVIYLGIFLWEDHIS